MSDETPRPEERETEKRAATDERASTDADPLRIYAFADALDAERTDDDAPAGPAPRLETWITLAVDAETYALPVEPVREVLRVTGITRVPHAPSPVRGVTQLRGRVIPVVDLALRLGLAERGEHRAQRILVVESRGRLLGLLVDRVHQVVQLDRNRVQDPPEDVMTPQSDFVTAVYHHANQLILMLDVHRVLEIHEAPDAA